MEDSIPYLIELRKRLLRALAVLLAVFIIASFFANNIYHYLALPLLQHFSGKDGLIATAVSAPLLVPFKSALMLSLFITIPYLLLQVWQFVAPALYKQEKRFLWLTLFSTSILFYCGALFAYFVILPVVFKFFIYIAPQGVEVRPDINLYFSFIVTMFISFGLAFEIPIVIYLLVKTKLVKRETLVRKRPYIIVGAFILGMLLTPPDVISQLLLAIPIWLLFEAGLLLARYL